MSTLTVHLEGMGLLGSLTAWQLSRRGVEFTWNDTEENVTAWKACTGACYPSGGGVDTRCYNTWAEWLSSSIYPSGCLERCAYWVDGVTKTLPHGLDTETLASVGGMRLAGHSIHVNAQRLVRQTRNRFLSSRCAAPPNSLQIIAHGFSKRRARYLWGWTRLIKLQYNHTITEHGRPSFYLRKNRFQFAYCYPQPGTDCWYAGSSLISQHAPKQLRVLPKYELWKKRFSLLTGGTVKVVWEGPVYQGWRPAKVGGLSVQEGKDSDGGCEIMEEDGVIYYPVMASNGFRHFPAVWAQLAARLGV